MMRHRAKYGIATGLLAGAGWLAGCVALEQSPPDLAHIRVEGHDSPRVRVSKAWLERRDGGVVLRGHVLRRPETIDTTETHLDVVLLDREGQPLRTSVAQFAPRQIGRRYRQPDSADFAVPLAGWPEGLSRIEVTAHEGAHRQDGGER